MLTVEYKWQVYECLLYYSFNFFECLKIFNIYCLDKRKLWMLRAHEVLLVGEQEKVNSDGEVQKALWEVGSE